MSLSRIRAEPFSQVVHGFTAAEEPDRDDLRPALGGVGDGSGTRAGDDQAPRGTLRPHPLGDCRLRQVIEHDQPGLAGFLQPADKARSARLSLPDWRYARGGRRGLRESGQGGCPAGGRDPDQRIDNPGSPQ